MNNIKDFFCLAGRGMAYEWHHAVTHFTQKSENVRVLTNLFKKAEKSRAKSSRVSEPALTGQSGLHRFALLSENRKGPSRRVDALDLAGLPFQKPVPDSSKNDVIFDPLSRFSDPEALRRRSALKKEDPKVDVSSGDLATVLGDSSQDLSSSLKSYKKLIDLHVECESISDEWIESFDRSVQKAGQFDRAARNVEAHGKNDFLKEECAQLVRQIENLEEGQTFLFQGHINNRGAVNFHPEIQSLLKDEMNPSLYRFIFEDGEEEFIKQVIDHLKEQLKGFDKFHCPDKAKTAHRAADTIIQFARHALHDVLPGWWYDRVVENTKEDLLEILLGQDRSGLAAQYAERIWSRMQREGLEAALEKELVSLLADCKESVLDGILNLTNDLTRDLPKTLKYCLDAAGISQEDGGAYLLQARKKENGKLKISVISLKTRSALHKRQGPEGRRMVQLPLVFDNISPKKLDELFFSRLLTYQTWPGWSKSISYNMSHFKKMLCRKLGKPLEEFVSADLVDGNFGKDYLKILVAKQMASSQQNPLETVNKLFDYTIPFEALINFWPRVVFDPSILDQASQRSLLKRVCGHLTRKGAELYKAGKITMDELETLNATLWEVKDTLSQIKEKKRKKVLNASMAVPGELRSFIKDLLESTGSSEASLEMVKDFCLAVAGEEFEGVFDEILAEIVPTLEPHVPDFQTQTFFDKIGFDGIFPSLRDIKRAPFSPLSSLRILGKILNLIKIYWLISQKVKFTASALEALVPQLSQTRLGTHTISLLIVLLGPDFVRDYVPNTLFNTVVAVARLSGEIWSYLYWRIGMIMLRAAAAALLDDEQVRLLTEHARNVLTREGALTFEFIEKKPAEKPAPTIVYHEMTSDQCEGDLCPFYTISSSIKPPEDARITSENALEVLESWNCEVERDYDDHLFRMCENLVEVFINESVRSLPVPSQSESGLWDKVEEPEKVLEELHKLMLHHRRYCSKAVPRSSFEFYERLTTSFTLYAIIDKVARSIPEARIPKEYKANGADLASFLGLPTTRMPHGITRSRLYQVARYFELVPFKRYCWDEIRRYQDQRFFNYFDCVTELSDSQNTFSINESSFASTAEAQYYASILENPEMRKRQEDMGVPAKSHSYRRYMHLFFGDAETIIPRPFTILRMAHLLASDIKLNRRDEDLFSSPENSQRLEMQGDKWMVNEAPQMFQSVIEFYDQNILPYMGGRDRRIQSNLPIGCVEHVHVSNIIIDFSKSSPSLRAGRFTHFCRSDPKEYWLFELTELSERSASEVMMKAPFISEGNSDAKSGARDPLPLPVLRHIELLKRHPSDQIVRCMSLFMNMKRRLSMGGLLWLFDYVANDPRAIRQQLIENPKIVLDWKRFFEDAISVMLDSENYGAALRLSSIGIEFFSHCGDSKELAFEEVPDFRGIIRNQIGHRLRGKHPSDRQIHNVKDGLTLALIYLASTYYDSSADHLCSGYASQEDEMMFDLARLAFSRSPWFWRVEMRKLQEAIQSKIVLYRLGQQLKEKMETSAEFRNRVLDQLVLDTGLTPDPGAWSGEYPIYFKGALRYNLEKTEAPLGQDSIKDIEEEVGRILNRSVDGGIYTSQLMDYPNLGVRVKRFGKEAYHLYQLIEGRWCRHIAGNLVEPKPSDYKTGDKFWLEDNSSASPTLFQYRGSDMRARHTMSLALDGNQRTYTLVKTESLSDDATTSCTRLDGAYSGLALLNWFHPLAKIQAHTKKKGERTEIRRIEMEGLDLSFNVVDGKAFCDSPELSGYFISPRQKEKALYNYPRYLLLENQHGDRKVMVPRNSREQLIGEFVFKNLANISSSPYLDNMIAHMLSRRAGIETRRVDTYALGSSGLLESHDQEAMAYLALYHLSLGDEARAESLIQRLQDEGRRVPYSPEVLELFDHMVVPLAVSQSKKAERTFLRLTAVRESNGLIHCDRIPEINRYDIVRWMVAQKKYYDYLSAIEYGQEAYLSPYEELLILKYISRLSKKTFQERFGHILRRFPIPVDDLVENLAMMPKLAKRFNDLQVFFQEGDSWMRTLRRTGLEFFAGEKTDCPMINLLPADPVGKFADSVGLTHSSSTSDRIELLFHDIRQKLLHPFEKFDIEGQNHIQLLISGTDCDMQSLSFDLIDLTPQYLVENFWNFYRAAHEGNPEMKTVFPLLEGEIKRSGYTALLCQTLQTIAAQKSLKDFIDPDFIMDMRTLTQQIAMDRTRLKSFEKQITTKPGYHAAMMIPGAEVPEEFRFAVAAWHLVSEELHVLEKTYGLMIRRWQNQQRGYFWTARKGYCDILSDADVLFDAEQGEGEDVRFYYFKRRRNLARQWMERLIERKDIGWLENLYKISDHISDREAWKNINRLDYRQIVRSADSEICSDPHKFLLKLALGEKTCTELSFRRLIDHIRMHNQWTPPQIFDRLVSCIILQCKQNTPGLSLKKIAAKHALAMAAGSSVDSTLSFVKMSANQALRELSWYNTGRRYQMMANASIWAGTRIFSARKAIGNTKMTAAEERARRSDRLELSPIRKDCLRAMMHREEGLNRVFQELVKRYLVVAQVHQAKQVETNVELFEEGTSSQAFEKLKTSLDEYYRLEPEPGYSFTIQSDVSFQDLLKDLKQLQKEIGRVLLKSRRDIEDFTNKQRKKPQSEEEELLNQFTLTAIERRDLTFDEIDQAFIQERDDILTGQLRLTDDELMILKRKLYIYHIMASRFNLLFDQLDRISDLPEDKAVALIGRELVRRRVYRFDSLEKCERILRGKLVFESRTKKLLRKKQSEQMDRMLTDPSNSRLVVEMIMGSGKTWYGIPMTDYVFSAINIWPAATAATNIPAIGRQARDIFAQASNAFSLSRRTRWTADRLWALAKAFERAFDEREQINMTKQSAQAIELCFLEQVLDVDHRFKGDKHWHKRIDLFRKILLHMRTKGIGNIDEAHKAFDNRKELNHPLGKKRRLDDKHVHVVEQVLHLLVNSEELEGWLTIKSEKPSPLPQSVYFDKVMPLLAKRIVEVFNFDIEQKHSADVQSYLMGGDGKIPACVLQSEQRAKVDLVKGLLTTLLPTALEKTIHVDFNPSKEGNGEQARPSEGNDNPLECSSIRSPYEALVKTGLMLLHDRLSDTQLTKFLDTLRLQARVKAKKRGCCVSETAEGMFFAEHCPGYELDTFSEKDRPDIYRILNRSDRVVLKYCSSVIAKQIHYFPQNLSSNSSNFGSMLRSFFSDTGTPYNLDCYPTGTYPLYDPGTDGESLDVMLNEENVLGIQVLSSEAPKEALDEMIACYVEKPDSNVSAFIDRGAVFNGLSSEVVAREILRRAPERFRGVAFYLKGELVMLERGGDRPVPYHTSSVKPDQRLSYFPQPQTFAADIPQQKGAVGVVTVGEDLRFNELAQAVWRMRGLKRDGQKLIFAMTERVRQLISSEAIPTVKDIIACAARNEERALSQDHFEADKQKLHNVMRSAVLDKALNSEKTEELIRIIQEFHDIFVTHMEADPTKLFGYVDAQVAPSKVFQALRRSYADRLKKTGAFDAREKKALLKEMRAIGRGRYPELVHSYIDGEALVSGGLDDIGKETQIDVDHEVEAEEETEINLDIEQDQDLNQNMASRHPEQRPQKYCRWPQELFLTNLDWLKTQKTPRLSDYSGFRLSNMINPVDSLIFNPPPIFYMRRALKMAGGPEASEIWNQVSSMILTTNNVTYLAANNGCPIEPFGPFQVPVYEALVILEKERRPKLLLLDQQEAEHWKRYLREDRDQGVTDIKYGLVDITTQMIVAYGNSGFDKSDLKSENVQRALTQVKFLRGDVEYSKKQGEYLRTWLKTRTREMEDYFLYVHKNHGTTPYEGSPIHEIFLEIQEASCDQLLRG